jgi:DNA invertase Pin-like site-specific DNA recombinase
MPSTSHVLDEARDLLKNRLAELDDERKRLESALSELGGKVTSGVRRGRPAKKRSARASKAAPRRRRRKGTRSDQAVGLVEKSPGISASEIAKAMKIKPNYLYRVLSDLEKEGRVKKKGRQYFPGKK